MGEGDFDSQMEDEACLAARTQYGSSQCSGPHVMMETRPQKQQWRTEGSGWLPLALAALWTLSDFPIGCKVELVVRC
ncbi:hypothetical protein NDU88_004504 [Pleurodeles waltl]|uniref:Uncharacterized protein n=1 Tax=Pleurodeles waltl TaxID=8319 RepID=A0AAV7QCX7_PLEWA|nr:hypothetical protein NDU88_004504 [Pleurodeles waltl]